LRVSGILHFALGEEGVDQAGALRAVQALQEQLALERQAFVERQVQAACTASMIFSGREQAARLLGRVGTCSRNGRLGGGLVGQPLPSRLRRTGHAGQQGLQFAQAGRAGVVGAVAFDQLSTRPAASASLAPSGGR
jgi:hypothetical protein